MVRSNVTVKFRGHRLHTGSRTVRVRSVTIAVRVVVRGYQQES